MHLYLAAASGNFGLRFLPAAIEESGDMARDVLVAPPRFNIDASIRDLLHEVRLVQGCLDAQIDRLERIERDLVALLGGRGVGAGRRIFPDPGRVAHNLEVYPRPDGSAAIAIDGGLKFILAAQLAEVFQFIASGDKDRSGKDPLVGWRPRAAILRFLEESAGRSLNPRYVNNLVHRLKKALQKAGYDCSLIQTHREKGVRFAFKRGAQSPADAALPGWPSDHIAEGRER